MHLARPRLGPVIIVDTLTLLVHRHRLVERLWAQSLPQALDRRALGTVGIHPVDNLRTGLLAAGGPGCHRHIVEISYTDKELAGTLYEGHDADEDPGDLRFL